MRREEEEKGGSYLHDDISPPRREIGDGDVDRKDGVELHGRLQHRKGDHELLPVRLVCR